MNQITNQFHRIGISPWLFSVAFLLIIFFIIRLVLLIDNSNMIPTGEWSEIFQSLVMGSRFDLRMALYACLPLALFPLSSNKYFVGFLRIWLFTFTASFVFLGLIEIEFYKEFQQRLNALVLQYLSEDHETVIKMIWGGFPVAKYSITFFLSLVLIWQVVKFMIPIGNKHFNKQSWLKVSSIFLVILLISTIGARGTLRSGPPLRWGDAFQSEYMFLNHMALNGSYTFSKALIKWLKSDTTNNIALVDATKALQTTRNLLLTTHEEIIEDGRSAVKRMSRLKKPVNTSPKNVVVILMESFSARYVGAFGNDQSVTPEFDVLTKEGLIFDRFFSNGTHTHQGIFATLSCFPNLPNHEYLMQQPEGRNQFSGITRLLPDFENIFVYNGDFNWDNQLGFFRNQGLTHFIGRHDIEAKEQLDNVWGVYDEQMFDRAEVELDRLSKGGPFVAILQTLSNHMPYELPSELEFDPVMIDGELSERLTAMKYSDWALGKFFKNIRDMPYYKETLFVIIGDHGFAVPDQLTGVNLLRFHVPLLLVGDIPSETKGTVNSVVGSQVDVVPTIVGMMGKTPVQQCWGRNLFDIQDDDKGFAIIKPSGGEPTIAIVKDDLILTYDKEQGSHLYRYDLGLKPAAVPIKDEEVEHKLKDELLSYVQTAQTSLRENTTSN